MVDEAIKSLKNLFLVTLTIGLIWLVSWSSAIERFNLYQDVLDLHAWLFLKEGMKNLNEQIGLNKDEQNGIFELKADESIQSVSVPDLTKAVRDQRDITWIREPIKVSVTWPIFVEHHIMLVPEKLHHDWDPHSLSARIYKVVITNGNSELLLSEYRVVFFPEGRPLIGEKHNPAIIPIDAYRFKQEARKGQRQLEQFSTSFNKPKSWNRVTLYLNRHGFNTAPTELTSQHAALVKLRAESDPRSPTSGTEVMGVRLSLAYLFTAVGFFLLATAFAMMGPVIALRRSQCYDHTSAWIMVVPMGNGFLHRLLEGVIVSASIVWTVFPLVILLLQFTAHSNFTGIELWFLRIGAFGLAFSSIIYGMASWELHECRKISK